VDTAFLGNGKFRITARGVRHSAIPVKNVRFDCLVGGGAYIYNGTQNGEDWYADISLSSMGMAYGSFTVQAVGINSLGSGGIMGRTTVEYEQNKAYASSVSLRPEGNGAVAFAGSVYYPPNAVWAVRFAAWSDRNGQDDLVWYDGWNDGNSNWVAFIDPANHNNESGLYNVHAYAVQQMTGNMAFIGAMSIELGKSEPMKAGGVSLRNENPPNGNTAVAFAGPVTGGTGGIKNVRFAAWTAANNQNDLKWYDGWNDGAGNWVAQVDIANHKYRSGEYYVHAYAEDNAGNLEFVGAASVSLGQRTAA